MSAQQPSSNNTIFYVPVAIVLAIVASAAWVFARLGASYRFTRTIAYPASFVLGELFGAAVYLAFGWVIMALIGGSAGANWIFSHAPAFFLFTLTEPPSNVPVWQIVVYQFCVWLFFIRPISRSITTSVFDFAIVGRAYSRGMHPYYLRQEVIQNDHGYAKSYAHYRKVNGNPLLGMALVVLSPCPIAEFYC